MIDVSFSFREPVSVGIGLRRFMAQKPADGQNRAIMKNIVVEREESMRYIEYRSQNFRPDSERLIGLVDGIIREYVRQGYVLTLRQIYYQLVARGIIENKERSYKSLGSLVNDARIAGLLPWDGIEDRAREFKDVWTNESLQKAVGYVSQFYVVDFWDRQDYYVEVWVEKEALGNVIERPCKDLRVPYMSCKGYLSASQSWRGGERYERAAADGKKGVLIHLGDHDPSGIDMTRDNGDRLELFSRESGIEVRRIALNIEQVQQYNPPPNPAKMTDTRATNYVARFGDESWELDALEPSVIDGLIRTEITTMIDPERWDEAQSEETEGKAVLSKLGSQWSKVETFLKTI
jgi:hypothetical protein